MTQSIFELWDLARRKVKAAESPLASISCRNCQTSYVIVQLLFFDRINRNYRIIFFIQFISCLKSSFFFSLSAVAISCKQTGLLCMFSYSNKVFNPLYSCILISFHPLQGRPWPPARRAYASESTSCLEYNVVVAIAGEPKS